MTADPSGRPVPDLFFRVFWVPVILGFGLKNRVHISKFSGGFRSGQNLLGLSLTHKMMIHLHIEHQDGFIVLSHFEVSIGVWTPFVGMKSLA